MLEREPDVSLTIKGVADAVGSAPMALYRYFPDRDALLQAAADHVLDEMDRVSVPDGPWQYRLRFWMQAAHGRIRPYPQLVPYLFTTTRPNRLLALGELNEILAPIGLGWEDYALTVSLANATLIGYSVYESRRRPATQTAALFEQLLEDLPEQSAANGQAFLAALPAAYARLHGAVIDQVIMMIEHLAAQPTPPSPEAENNPDPH